MDIKRAGYIFVETVVAMAVLSLSTLVIQGALRQAIMTRRQTQDYTTARFLLENLAGERTLMFQQPEGSGAGQCSPPYENYSYEWKIEKVDVPLPPLPIDIPPIDRQSFEENYVDYMGKLTVRIKWNRAGVEHEALGETLLRPALLWLPEEMR
jgi:hypothetical protein